MKTITIEVNGEKVEIPVSQVTDALPDGYSLNTPDSAADGYVPEGIADYRKNQAVKNATQGMIPAEEAAQDDDVIASVLEEHGEDVDLDAHRNQWQEDQLQPVQEQLDNAISELTLSQLMAAGRAAGVKEEHLEGGAESFLAFRVLDQLDFNDEHGVIALDGDDPMPGRDGRSFANAQDLLTRMKENGSHAGLFEGQKPQGGGGSFNGGSGDGGGQAETFTQEQIGSMSPEEFEKNQEAINKAAAEGRIQ